MRVLLTAFDLYDDWQENSSWLTLVDLLQNRPAEPELITRRYPVDLGRVLERLKIDLNLGIDAVLHLGQSPGSPQIKLEMVAINVAGRVENDGGELKHVIGQGPVGHRSAMPMARWAQLLCDQGIPACVSYHAGTYLCNATMYASIEMSRAIVGAEIPVGFVHLPLAPQQVAKGNKSLASMDVKLMSKALLLMLGDLATLYGSAGKTKSGVELA